MDKYIEALNSISSYEIWHSSSYDDEGYCNDDDYTEYPFSDSEDIEILSELITKHDILNKGIDELIELLEIHINNCQNDSQGVQDICNLSISFEKRLLEKLKKLKGE